MTTRDLSVVVPAYNEEARIGPSLDSLLAYFARQPYRWELIVVDDGSRDGTAQIVTERISGVANARLISYSPNRGKGAAIRTGVLASQGAQVLFCDADLSTPIGELERLLPLLEAGNDIVIGSRAAQGASATAPAWRRFGGLVFRVFRNAVVGFSEFVDSQCGFKLFRGDVARRLFAIQRIDRFMFDIEVLYLANRLGYRIAEAGVRWSYTEGTRHTLGDFSINWIRDLIVIRWNARASRRGEPNAVERDQVP